MSEKFPNYPNESFSMRKKMTRRNFIKTSLEGLVGFALRIQLPIKVSVEEMTTIPINSKEFFYIQRIKEQIRHLDGTTLELQSIAQNGEYYPSFNNSLFEKKETPTSSEISGGFPKDLKVSTRFGTFAETVPTDNIDNLLSQNKDNIYLNDNLISILKHLAQDSYVFITLSQFFKDGGKIKLGRGLYINKPLEIQFGSESALYHELLHYIFDKENSILYESKDTRGADHYAISPLTERFNIIQAINQGTVPLEKDIQNLYGFTLDGKASDKIKKFLESNDLQGLNSYLLSDDFYKNYVHSGMISPLYSIEYNKNHRDFRLKLSDGNTLRIIEDYTLKDSDSIKKVDYGGTNGKFIDVKLKDIKNFNIELLQSYIPNFDIKSVKNFLDEHKNNDTLDRNYILTPDQIHDIAYLNFCNAIILENAFILAIEYSKRKNMSFEKVFSEEAYKKVFQNFVNQFTLLEQDKKNHFPIRKKINSITQQLIKKIQ